MKIIQVVREAEGGIATHLLRVVKDHSPGFQMVVIGPEAPQWKAEHCFPLIPWSTSAGFPNLTSSLRLARLLHREQADAIHVHGMKALGQTVCALQLWPLAVDVFYTAHSVPALPADCFKRWWTRRLYGMLLRRVNTIISVSDAVRNSLLEYVPAHRVHTVYNGVHWQAFQRQGRLAARALVAVDSQAFVVGTVARLVDGKGLRTLLKTAMLLRRIVPQIHFLVVGDGPERVRLETYRDRLGLQNCFHFTGYRDDIPNLLPAFDVFVLPSYSEGLGVSVLEAMAAGLPIIASHVGGLPEVVAHGRNGLLVEAGDTAGLGAAIVCCYRDPERWQRIGEANRSYCRRFFDSARMVRELEELYAQVAHKRPGSRLSP